MKDWRVVLAGMFAALAVCPLASQTPVLGNIEAPYPAVQAQVKIAGTTYGSGVAAYGPVGTPLFLSGSGFGASGSVQFIPYVNGSPQAPVQASVSNWSSTMLSLTVPSGAASGLVKVTTGGKQSNGLPFLVTPGAYSGTCPASASASQLQIVTMGLDDGAVGEVYNVTLQGTGGTGAYIWANPDSSLPAGLSLNPSTGVISGTPTTQAIGTVDVTLQLTDSSSPAQSTTTVLSLTVTTSSAPTVLYSYSIPSSGGYDAVGNVLTYTDSVTGTWSMGYDSQNRLISGSSPSNSSGPYAGLQAAWSYDSFGNRTSENFSGTLANPAIAPPIPGSSSATYDANNHVETVHSGFPPQYDAAGDVTCDAYDVGAGLCYGNKYLYDAGGRICAVASSSSGMTEYLYDAEGTRVAKGKISSWSCDTASNGFAITTSYILDPGNQQLTELTWSGGTPQWAHTNVWAAGQLIATYSADPDPAQNLAGILNFYLDDWLGTRRAMTDYTGNLEETCHSLPYGNGDDCMPTPTEHLFTGKERDTESGNDYFGARYYASSMGRFLSPDPVVITSERLANPQQLNLYAYVANNPLRFIDPTGEILQCVGDDKSRSQCFADLQQIAGDAANRLSMDAKTGVVSFDTKGLDLSKNEGASLVNNLVGSKNTYDFSVGPTIMTDKGSVRIDVISPPRGDIANLPAFGDQRQNGNPPAGVSDILDLYLNNPNITLMSNTNLKVAPEWTVAFHELAEAFEKIDGGKGGSYEAGHNAALQREMTLRDQRPYLKQYNTGAGGPANSPNPEGGIIIKK